MNRFERCNGLPSDMHPDLARFLEYWRRKKGSRLMPEYDDIQIQEIPDLADGLFSIDIHYEEETPKRFQYRHVGKSMMEVVGQDIAGRFLDEIYPRENYLTLQADYHDAITMNEPRYLSYLNIPSSNAMILFERLLLPVGREGATRPDSFVGLHVSTAKGTASLTDACHPFISPH